MKTTKLLTLLLAFLLLLTACGTDKTNSAASSSETESPLTDPPKTNAPETNPPETEKPIRPADDNFISITTFVFEGNSYSLEYMLKPQITFSVGSKKGAALALRIRESQELKDYLKVLERVVWKYKYDESPAETVARYFERLRYFNIDGSITESGKYMYTDHQFKHNMYDFVYLMREVAYIHGYSDDDFSMFWYRFEGSMDPPVKSEWDHDFNMPYLYEYIVWYNSAVHPITKEDLKAASKAIEDCYPNYCLSDEDIDILLTFDDDYVKNAFLNPVAFVFNGTVSELRELIHLENGEWVPRLHSTEVRQYIGTDELKEYIETIRNFEYFDPEDRAEYVEALTALYNYSE